MCVCSNGWIDFKQDEWIHGEQGHRNEVVVNYDVSVDEQATTNEFPCMKFCLEVLA